MPLINKLFLFTSRNAFLIGPWKATGKESFEGHLGKTSRRNFSWSPQVGRKVVQKEREAVWGEEGLISRSLEKIKMRDDINMDASETQTRGMMLEK